MANESLGACVFDTNTLVSAFLFPGSVPGLILAAILGQGRLLASIDTAAELAEVLRRPKFDRYLSRKRRKELIVSTINACTMIEVASSIQVCRDPHDNKFLELAVDGNANTIVTGDADLLELHPFRDIQILTPRKFFSQYD